jgi:hypothetical protein
MAVVGLCIHKCEQGEGFGAKNTKLAQFWVCGAE